MVHAMTRPLAAWPLGRIQSPFQPLLEDGIEGRRRLNGVKNARARINVGLNRIAGDDRLAKCVNGGGCQFVELRRCTGKCASLVHV